MDKQGNILFCGVGGQGIILASEITSYAFMEAGYDVKKSEVHGMAQRGGSVVAHLRYGKKVYSPLIEHGTADLEVAFEPLESVRYLPYLHRKSVAVVNTRKIYPPSVATGLETYPDDVLNIFREMKLSLYPVDAFAIATSLGEPKAVNMVLVGVFSCFLPVSEKIFLRIIDSRIPERFRSVNRDAFMEGRTIIRGK